MLLRSSKKGIHWLKIVKIISITLPSIIFGIFTIVFTLQQNNFAKLNREQDQRQADEENNRIIFQNYLNDISTFLLRQDFNRSNSEHLLQIRVKTLAVLHHVDINRKRDIILFLYESRL
jgi:hypothetical protein